MISVGAVIKYDVLDYAVMVGVPAKQEGWACKCGTTQRFKNRQTVCSYCFNEYTLKDEKINIEKEIKDGPLSESPIYKAILREGIFI